MVPVALGYVGNSAGVTRTPDKRRIAGMIAKIIKNIGKSDHASHGGHLAKDLLVFTVRKLLVITLYSIESVAAEHCRAMRKRHVWGVADQPPAIARPGHSSVSVNPLTQCANDHHIGPAFKDCPLTSQPITMRNVVGVHAGHNASGRLFNDEIGTG